MAKKAYRIKGWEKHFQKAQSRKVVGDLKWMPVPISFDGKKYKRLSTMEGGTEVFGAFVLIAEVAARYRAGGWLVDEHGDAIDAEGLWLITNHPKDVFERALKVLCGDQVGWMEWAEWEGSGSRVVAQWEQSGSTVGAREDEIREDEIREDGQMDKDRGAAGPRPSSSKLRAGGEGHDALARALCGVGIGSPNAVELIMAIPWMTAQDVYEAHASATRKHLKRPDYPNASGLTAFMLKGGQWDSLAYKSPRGAANGFKKGEWNLVNSINFANGKIGINNEGLFLGGVLMVAVGDIGGSRFGLNPSLM